MEQPNFARRSPADGYRLAIVNPLTLVGKELAEILGNRAFPYSTIALIDTTGDAAGTLTEVDDSAMVVNPATDVAFEDLDVVFFCGPSTGNEPWISRHQELGFIAIDLSQPPSFPDQGVAVVAGVNAESIPEGETVLLSPDPFVLPVVLLLDRIHRSFPVELAAATVTRPASEFGQQGIDELFQQTIKVLNLEPFPTDVFGRQAAFTVYPPPDAKLLEARASASLRAVLGNEFPVSLHLLQGALFHAHAISLFVLLKDEADESRVLEALAKREGFAVPGSDDPVTTLDAAGKDEVVIGRISRDDANPRGLWIWAVCDNLRRGSALNAVMIAESLMAKYGPKPN